MKTDSSADNVVPCVGKKVKELPSAEWLNERFLYEEDTGRLIWRTRPREHFLRVQDWKRWNNKHAGKDAGNKVSRRGGVPSCILTAIGDGNGTYLVHRIAFAMKGVVVPDGIQIDHINGDPWDNRWVNLRLATHSQNQMNSLYTRKSRSTKGLPKGVFLVNKKFQAVVNFNKQRKYLGTFNTPQEAEAAYISAASELHKEFLRTGIKEQPLPTIA